MMEGRFAPELERDPREPPDKIDVSQTSLPSLLSQSRVSEQSESAASKSVDAHIQKILEIKQRSQELKTKKLADQSTK